MIGNWKLIFMSLPKENNDLEKAVTTGEQNLIKHKNLPD